jgi:2-amino-4-hydroxy-6-hydroxymethyldihydropteridine diphosphokinase
MAQAVVAYIAVGANLGDRRANIERALQKIAATPDTELLAVSRLMENPAVGSTPDAPPFLNGAIAIRTRLAAHPLLHRLLEIEHDIGRERRIKWEPRPIDLDLLLYGNHVLSSQELVVPHPLMHERRFVLEPLAEIAPDAVHPMLNMTIAGLLANLDKS